VAVSTLKRSGPTKDCIVATHCLQDSQGLSTTGAGAGAGGAGLGWHVLKASQPSRPPMHMHTETVVSLLQSCSLLQSKSSTHVVADGAPAWTHISHNIP
jgi:hypothetical protein